VFPVLAVAANVLAVAVLVPTSRRRLFVSARGPLVLAALVAVTATLGSLFLSEAAGFVPCVLCWYQRIAMYPLAVLGVVAAWRRDAAVWVYAAPLAAVGLAVSVWHYLVERVPTLSAASSCSVSAPCDVRWVDAFGFVTIPYMAGSGFALILACLLAAARLGRAPAATDD
jgi:disulfide bond formation protein DsbB